MSPGEENKRLSVRFYLKKKERGEKKRTVIFMSVIIQTADSFDSCSSRTVNSWRTDSVSDAGSSLASEWVFSHLLSPLLAPLQISYTKLTGAREGKQELPSWMFLQG